MRKLILGCIALFLAFPVYTQQQDRQTNIAIINFLGTQAFLIEKYKEDSPTLQDIYRKIENDTMPYVFGTESTRRQIRTLFNNITDFEIYELRRERIRVIRENARARAIQQAVPSPVFFLSLASNIKDPLALIVNIAGMAAQSVTSYMNASEQADLNAYIELSKLTEQQKGSVNNLCANMYDYMSRTAREYGLKEDYDTVSKVAIKEFIDNTTVPNLANKLNFLVQQQATYQNYYPYWLDLANTYYARGRYSECLEAIRRYEAIRAPILRPNRDVDYSRILVLGITALSNVYSGEEYRRRCLEFLKKIEANAPFEEWSIRYAAALAYLDIASGSPLSERRALLNSAYQLLKGNMNRLITDEQKSVREYVKPLEAPKKDDPRYLVKQEYDRAYKAYERAQKTRRTELPPFNYALYSNFYALYGVMEQLNMPESEKKEIAEMTREVFFIPDFRIKYFNVNPEEAYRDLIKDGHVIMVNTRFNLTQPFFGNSKLNLTLPSLFFWSGSTARITIEQVIDDYENWPEFKKTKKQIFKTENISLVIKNVNRPSFAAFSGSTLNEIYLGKYNETLLGMYMVETEFDLGQKINLDKKNDYLVTVSIDNFSPLAVMFFINESDSLKFFQRLPWMFANGVDEEGYFKTNIGLDYAIRSLTDKTKPRGVWGPEKNSVIKETLNELNKYLISNNYRYIPSKNKTIRITEAANSEDYKLSNIFVVLSLLYDPDGVIGIHLETSTDGRSADIVIVRRDNKLEYRHYEK